MEVSFLVPAMLIRPFQVGVGLAACIVPLFIGELSPTKQRGRLVTVNVVSITLVRIISSNPNTQE